MRKLYLFFRIGLLVNLLLSISANTFAQSLRINEFMALNQNTITDEDGTYSDWIEIYNPTSSAVNMAGWTLTDDKSVLSKWAFPEITLNTGAYLVVFASSKDRSTTSGELHTNFNLSGSGEYLALTKAGVVVSAFDPSYPAQQTDYSYGYYDGAYIQFSDPTPGKDNTQSSGTVIPAPVFSVQHGYFNDPFQLTISSSISNAKIYYTNNGSTPTKNNGTVYASPINISKTSVIRAVAIVEGEAPGKITTQTYLFLSDVIHQNNTPAGYPNTWGPYTAISGDAIADYEMDPDMMKDAAFAESAKNALLDLPTVSLVTDIGYLFSHSVDPDNGGIYIYTGPPLTNTTNGTGRGWERPVSFEYFDAKDASLQVDCGIRIQGGHGRRPEKSPKHSFLLNFDDLYGTSRLDYPLFGDASSSKHQKIILRAGFGNSWIHHDNSQRIVAQYQRDIWTKDTQRDMGSPSSNSIYVHLFINGIYWGIYAPSERMDSDFAEEYLGGNDDDYDVIKDYAEVSNGEITAWNKMMQMANAGLETPEKYQQIIGNNPDGTPNPEIESMVDPVNLADYMLVNFYGSNSDWDHHNWSAMRNRVNPGKGFRFFCWDGELVINSVNGNVLSENNENCPSRVYQQMIKNEEFKRLFADRIQRHCFNGGALTPEATANRWMKRSKQIENAIVAESARWGDYRRDVHPYQTAGPFMLYTKEDHWIPQQNLILNTYFPQRTTAFLKQLRAEGLFPNIDAPAFAINGSTNFSSIISNGDLLSMTAQQGTIYYTTNGTDPVIWKTAAGGSDISLVLESADKRVMVPKSDIGTTWYTQNNFNDAAWKLCSASPGGIGYEKSSGYENQISLDVINDMYSSGTSPNTSCYVRIAFQVEATDLAKITSLAAKVRYDDGFVMYLNGQKVADANAPATLAWNAAATDDHESGSAETFDISSNIGLLKSGANVLAIHALNVKTSSSDFLFNVSLIGSNQPSSGSVAEEAKIYSGTIKLEESAHVLARTYRNGEWSAINNKFFVIPSDYYDLKITEIHYNPLSEDLVDGSDFEFIELKNTGTSTLDLGGLQFINGIEYEFPSETQLGAGEFVVLASNSGEFYSRYKMLAFGEYSGKLDNNGERIVLSTLANDTIIDFRYNDAGGWPESPDGEGNSLVPVDFNPTNNQTASADWRASYQIGGSPGADDILLSVKQNPKANSMENIVLAHNFPNPFSNITYIDYQIPCNSDVQLNVYNIMGQHIITLVNESQIAGLHQVAWNGSDARNGYVNNGIYIYRLIVRDQNQTRTLTQKMMLMR